MRTANDRPRRVSAKVTLSAVLRGIHRARHRAVCEFRNGQPAQSRTQWRSADTSRQARPRQTKAARAAGEPRREGTGGRAARPHDRSHPALGHLVAEHRRAGHGTPDRQNLWVESHDLRPELRPAEGRAVRNVHRRAEPERHFLGQHEYRRDGFRLHGAVNKGIPSISVVSGVVPARGLYDYGTNGFALAKIIDTI